VAFDDDLLDLAKNARFPGADRGEVLPRDPFEQEIEAGVRIGRLAPARPW
jgi:hypothetical protein